MFKYKKDNDKVHKSQYNFNSNLQYRPDDWGENRGH